MRLKRSRLVSAPGKCLLEGTRKAGKCFVILDLISKINWIFNYTNIRNQVYQVLVKQNILHLVIDTNQL